MVICLERGADLHMAQLMLLPLTVSCFSIIWNGFTVLVPADPGSPGQRAVKQVCVMAGVGPAECITVGAGCSLLRQDANAHDLHVCMSLTAIMSCVCGWAGIRPTECITVGAGCSLLH